MSEEKDKTPSIDFKELSTHESFKSSIQNFRGSVDEIGKIIELACQSEVYESLTQAQKVEYDLFQAYALNCLFWSYLRTQGVDPSKHGIKNELERVKTYMARAKQVHERASMPRVDKEAASRFVKSGLWEPGKEKIRSTSPAGQQNKKRKSYEIS